MKTTWKIEKVKKTNSDEDYTIVTFKDYLGTKVVKLDKNFAYVLAGVGMFLAVKGLEGMAGVTGAVIGPAQQTNVTLISFASFFVGAFLAIFAISSNTDIDEG